MDDAVKRLQEFVTKQSWGYQAQGPKSAEPTALACLALCEHGLTEAAKPLANWLAEIQSDDGSVGVTREQQRPAWPTSLAILAWLAYDRATGRQELEAARKQAVDWTLSSRGKTFPKRPQIGHDTTIPGWSWADATHAWIEPTCFFVLALKAVGQDLHPRTRDGVRMIVDRLHEQGGCNYGNTYVLGQLTMPHVQPTGIAMLAIAAERSEDDRIERSLTLLEEALDGSTATATLCFALIGLAAHRRRPAQADSLLADALARELEQGTSCHKLALIALASSHDLGWLPRSTPPTFADLAN